MKKTLWTIFLLTFLSSIIFSGCGGDGGINNINTTPGPTIFNISGKIYNSLINPNNFVSGVTIKIYKLTSDAMREGSAVYTDISKSDGSWGAFQANGGIYYEIELSKSGYTPVYHLYLPQINSNRSDANLEYSASDNLTNISGGFISVTKDSPAKRILSTDIIKLNDSANLNNSIVSDGTRSYLKIYKSNIGDNPGDRDYYVSAGNAPGVLYSVTYNQDIRSVRVFPCSLNHRTGVVFY